MDKNYKLSKERQVKKERLEQQIKEIEKKQGEIGKQISELRKNKTISLKQRKVTMLEKQIEIEDLESELQGKKQAISQLYIKEIEEELIEQSNSGKLSNDDQLAAKQNLSMYKRMSRFKDKMDNCRQEETILDLKKQLEIAKRNAHWISEEEADRSIMEIEADEEENEDVKKRYQEKEPTREEMYAIFEKMSQKFLSEKKEYIVKAEDLARRSSEQSAVYNEMSSQDINKEHNNEIYRYSNDLKKYLEDVETSLDTDDKKEKKIGEKYASIVDKNKKELANIFGTLEFRNREEQALLNVEKMNNISPRSLNELVNGEMFVATYEKRIDGEMKPIKEYYAKDAEGKIKCVGIGDEEGTKFDIGNNRHWTVDNKVIRGDIEESLTQHEIVDKVQKNTIQKDIKSGQVSQISKIMDVEFLEDFVKQCGVKDESWSYNKDFYVISTIDENGEEQYEVVYEQNGTYTKMQGLNQEKEAGKDIRVATPYTATTDKAKTLQEFNTKNGSRYAITRDEEDNIVFSEITKEQNGKMNAKAVESYSFTKDDIIPIAKEDEVVLENENARQAVNDLERSKEVEKENNQQNR